jgi:hypothetical protein
MSSSSTWGFPRHAWIIGLPPVLFRFAGFAAPARITVGGIPIEVWLGAAATLIARKTERVCN